MNSKIRKEIYSNLENAFFESQPAVCLELKVVLHESVSEILLVKLVSLIERLHFDGIFLAEIVRESTHGETHGCQLISVVRIMLEIDVVHSISSDLSTCLFFLLDFPA